MADVFLGEVDESYILGVDDILKIYVYGEKDLTGSYRVAKDGTISMPLIGELMLMGGVSGRRKSLLQICWPMAI